MKNILFFLSFCMIVLAKGQDITFIDLGSSGSGFHLRLDTSRINVSDKDKQIYSVPILGDIEEAQLASKRMDLVKKYKKDQLSTATKAELLYYVDCAKNKVALCKTTYYDSNGVELHSIDYCVNDKLFEKVKAETLRSDIASNVCKFAKH